MALGPIWPAYFQRVFGCCGSRALPTCFLKAPGVLPLLWTATLLVLRTVPRPSCSVGFAAAAIHDSTQVSHGLLAEGPENAQGSLLVDARKADADGALYGVTSTTHAGGARPQVGNLRRVLSRLQDPSDEGNSAPEHSVDPRDGLFSSDADSGDTGGPDEGSLEGGRRRFYADEFSTHSPREGEAGQEGSSVSEHPGTGVPMLPLQAAEEYEEEADNQRAREHTTDYEQEDGLSAGEEEGKGSHRDAGNWSHSDAGDRAASGEEERWDPDRSRHSHKGEPSREESVRGGRVSRDAAVETDEPVETERSRKASGRTHSTRGRSTRKRRCPFFRNAIGLTALLATLGVALLGGRAIARRGRGSAAAGHVRN